MRLQLWSEATGLGEAVQVPGLVFTPNDAVIPDLIWASQSEAGSQFVARMLTVITTFNIQKRDVLEFLTQACQAARFGEPRPSLLPQQ